MTRIQARVAASMLAAAMAFPTLAADPPAPAKAPRFPTLTYDQLNAYQKPLGEQIMKVSSIGLGGPCSALVAGDWRLDPRQWAGMAAASRLSPSASRWSSRSVVLRTESGLREMESMPAITTKSANSG